MQNPRGEGGRPWGGRLRQAADQAALRFGASVAFDRALARYDLRVSAAHARMLHRAGIVSAEDAAAIAAGLAEIRGEIETGRFPFDEALEDIHMNVEARLRRKIGAAAGRLHSGRSRNDQVATDLALYLRDGCAAARRGLAELRGVLLARAREHMDTVLPGYTHLQRAQPVRLAHHWLAFERMLARDAARFADAARRLLATGSPLGAGALAGSTLPLDRAFAARELGFHAPSANSMDSVASRDCALEFLAHAAICMVHLSRLAEELVLWSSSEFGFVELADSHATGSSLMPQKKNPDVPELVRGKSGRAIGNLVALLTVMKGLPLAYNRDMQEDKEPLFDSARTLGDSLTVMASALESLQVNAQRMAAAAADPLLLATDLVEALVREGVPFREAHAAVGRLVAHCLEAGLDLLRLDRAALREFHPAFPADAGVLLNLSRALESRAMPGATARSSVSAALSAAGEELAAEVAAIADADDESEADDAGGRAAAADAPAARGESA